MVKKGSEMMVCLISALLAAGCVTARAATYKMVEASPWVGYEDAWLAVVDAVSERFDIEVVDKDSGYLRTAWKQYTKFLSQYRTRCVAKAVSRKPFRVKIKVERQEYDSLTEEWVPKGNHTQLESEILADIRGRLHKR